MSVTRSAVVGKPIDIADAAEDLQVVARFAEALLLFVLLPQGVGLVANRVFASWKPVARAVGAIAPILVAIGLWSILADIDLARQQAAGKVRICGTGIMSGFLALPPFHLAVSAFSQAFMAYGARRSER